MIIIDLDRLISRVVSNYRVVVSTLEGVLLVIQLILLFHAHDLREHLTPQLDDLLEDVFAG